MKRQWFLLAVPLALALALIPLSRKQSDYIHLFERVPATEGCAVIDDGMWISPGEIVCASSANAGIGTIVGVNGTNPFLGGSKPTQLSALNVATGERRVLASAPPHHEISGTWGVSTSPDGKWILWPSMTYNPKMGVYFGGGLWNAMTLDGKQWVQRPRVADSITGRGVAWLPDSSGWVEACVINRARNGSANGVTLRVCSLKNKQVRKIDVPGAKNANNTFGVTKTGEAVIGCDGAGLQLLRVPLTKNGAVRSHAVKVPSPFGQATLLSRALISPNGDRIAWVFGDKVTATASLWLSDWSGQKSEPVAPDLQLDVRQLRNLRWTPDGKSLSCWRPTPGSKLGAYSFYRVNIPRSLSLKP